MHEKHLYIHCTIIEKGKSNLHTLQYCSSHRLDARTVVRCEVYSIHYVHTVWCGTCYVCGMVPFHSPFLPLLNWIEIEFEESQRGWGIRCTTTYQWYLLQLSRSRIYLDVRCAQLRFHLRGHRLRQMAKELRIRQANAYEMDDVELNSTTVDFKDGISSISHTDSVSKDSALRKGKWTSEEEDYATKIISLFNRGLLPIGAGTTLRSYLSEKLHWYVHLYTLMSALCSLLFFVNTMILHFCL